MIVVRWLGGDWDVHFSEDCYAFYVVHSEGENSRRFFKWWRSGADLGGGHRRWMRCLLGTFMHTS